MSASAIYFEKNPLTTGAQRRFLRKELHHLTTEEQALFEKFGQGPIVGLPETCIHHAFEVQAARHPQAVAVVHEEKSLTYRDLNERAESLALELIDKGVSRGDHVAIFLERSIPMVVGILAVLKIGAVYVPQDARIAPLQQLEHVLQATGARLILTLSHLSHLIPTESHHEMILLDDFLTAGTRQERNLAKLDERKALAGGEDVCFVLFTSGTTGVPNGVQVTHRNLCNILLTSPGNLGMGPGLKVSQILNIAFDMAAWEILGSLVHGSTLLIRGKDIEATVSQADIVIATPSILGRLDVDRCRNVLRIAVAGEPCPQALADKWSEFAEFYNCCGPTEVTIVNTMQLYDKKVGRLTIGRPTPNNTVYILNEEMKPCRIGEVGEMWAGGDCVSKSYLGENPLNQERYKADPFLGGGRRMFRTRDLGRWTQQGELEHLGRTDDQVKIRGFRVELDSISAVLETVPGCEQAVALKLDSRQLVAYVRPSSVDLSLARKRISELLPYYCMPGLIEAVEEFPTTSRGKIDKRQLTIEALQKLERGEP